MPPLLRGGEGIELAQGQHLAQIAGTVRGGWRVLELGQEGMVEATGRLRLKFHPG